MNKTFKIALTTVVALLFSVGIAGGVGFAVNHYNHKTIIKQQRVIKDQEAELSGLYLERASMATDIDQLKQALESAQAGIIQKPTAICRDNTPTWSTGSGTCSWHGGIGRKL